LLVHLLTYNVKALAGLQQSTRGPNNHQRRKQRTSLEPQPPSSH
jgi:hypothetical protein